MSGVTLRLLSIALPLACSPSAAAPVEEPAEQPVEEPTAAASPAEVATPAPSAAPHATGTPHPALTTRVVTVAPPEDPDAEFGPTCQQYFKLIRRCAVNAVAGVADPAQRASVQKTFDDALAATRDAWQNIEGASLDVACGRALDAMRTNPSCQ